MLPMLQRRPSEVGGVSSDGGILKLVEPSTAPQLLDLQQSDLQL